MDEVSSDTIDMLNTLAKIACEAELLEMDPAELEALRAGAAQLTEVLTEAGGLTITPSVMIALTMGAHAQALFSAEPGEEADAVAHHMLLRTAAIIVQDELADYIDSDALSDPDE